MPLSVFDQWKTYEREIVPVDAPPVQREECRRAFYAGCPAMFGLMLDATRPDDDDDCEANLQALDDELKAFLTDMRL